jgi:hypothetical protein
MKKGASRACPLRAVSCLAYFSTLKIEVIVPPKRQLTLILPPGIISQKLELHIDSLLYWLEAGLPSMEGACYVTSRTYVAIGGEEVRTEMSLFVTC